MKTLIITLILLVVVLYLFGGLRINFNPFRFQFTEWRYWTGILFLGVAIAFFASHYRKEGRTEAYKEVHQIINEVRQDSKSEK